MQPARMNAANISPSGGILPRDQHAFEVRMSKDATLEEARKWIGSTPRPAALNRERSTGSGGHDSRDGGDRMREGEQPDAEMVRLTHAEMARTGEKSYFTAQLAVMLGQP